MSINPSRIEREAAEKAHAAERRADYIRALEEEKAGLRAAGKKDRIKAVDAEIRRLTEEANPTPDRATRAPRTPQAGPRNNQESGNNGPDQRAAADRAAAEKAAAEQAAADLKAGNKEAEQETEEKRAAAAAASVVFAKADQKAADQPTKTADPKADPKAGAPTPTAPPAK